MNAYTVPLSCPRCGRPVDHRASGRPYPTLTQAIAHCAPCRTDYRVTVTMHDERRQG